MCSWRAVTISHTGCLQPTKLAIFQKSPKTWLRKSVDNVIVLSKPTKPVYHRSQEYHTFTIKTGRLGAVAQASYLTSRLISVSFGFFILQTRINPPPQRVIVRDNEITEGKKLLHSKRSLPFLFQPQTPPSEMNPRCNINNFYQSNLHSKQKTDRKRTY